MDKKNILKNSAVLKKISNVIFFSPFDTLMLYDAPNFLETLKTLKKKKGTKTRKHENTEELSDNVTS